MFSDPQSVTVNAVAKSLPRLGPQSKSFRDATGEFTLEISHSEGNRNRRVVTINQEKVGVDPFQTDTNRTYKQRVYIVIDHPKVGFTVTETSYLSQALVDWLSDANLLKVIAGES